jgi:hypothetical protein
MLIIFDFLHKINIFSARGQCIPYVRSMTSPRVNCSLGVREQANLVSSFIDGSQIYGNSKEETAQLRTFHDGANCQLLAFYFIHFTQVF